MKIITRGLIDWATLEVLEEDFFEYQGPVSQCKQSASSPQPVDPYTQANAQLGLSEGTAAFNAAMNRTGQSNQFGSTGWKVTGTDPATGAPIYQQDTQLAPQFQGALDKPLDTSGIAGMPGGPSTTDDLAKTRDSMYQQQMAMLQPEQDLASEQMDSKLANMGATIGSPAWNNEQARLSRTQGAEKTQARNAAIQAGGAEQSRLFGLGSQSLANQITARDQPIKEFQSMLGPQGSNVNAMTPDISGAFNQQYQGQLNQSNAQTATNNSNTQAGASLLAAYLMYLM